MGIDTTLRDHLRGGPCHIAWLKLKKGQKPDVTGFVRIHDILTSMYHAVGPNVGQDRPYMFSGAQLYTEFIKGSRAHFASGGLVYIIVADDPVNVPPEKKETQDTRTASSPIVPYPSESKYTFDARGMSIDGADSEQVDIRRLMRSRHIRPLLFQFLADIMKENEHVDDHCTLIFDYKAAQRPIIIGSNIPAGATVQHALGEADIGMFYWARFYKDFDVILQTTDTDFMPIFAAYYRLMTTEEFTPEQRDKKFYWVYDKDNTVDAKCLIRETLKFLNIPLRAFIALCILGGTDFYKKKRILHHFGIKSIIQYVQSTAKQWRTFGDETNHPIDNRYCLDSLLCIAYSRYLNNEPLVYREPLDDDDDKTKKRKAGEPDIKTTKTVNWTTYRGALKCPKSFCPPTDAEIRSALDRILWNVNYWNSPFLPIAAASAASVEAKKQKITVSE